MSQVNYAIRTAGIKPNCKVGGHTFGYRDSRALAILAAMIGQEEERLGESVSREGLEGVNERVRAGMILARIKTARREKRLSGNPQRPRGTWSESTDPADALRIIEEYRRCEAQGDFLFGANDAERIVAEYKARERSGGLAHPKGDPSPPNSKS